MQPKKLKELPTMYCAINFKIKLERRVGYSYLSNYAERLLKKNFPA